ncbi:hypothetical protein Cgig2_027573 [Carnegiea gigantea]|uniref:RING-type E3 ubiquitin transferase n=1 Tax=Carnegiea gigantea TaxID=171969 RepID=A0A9Q1JVI0_9CARY|nr:hypothetical protein Cgig2_027573 [Carnegiea gigantea]
MDLSPPPPPLLSTPSLFRSFPVMVIAIVGILATAFLLVGYYVFVIKCCLHWHRRRRRTSSSTANEAGDVTKNGLEEAVIRSIPVIKFRKLAEEERENEKSEIESYECANTANCPLCRSGVSLSSIPCNNNNNNNNNNNDSHPIVSNPPQNASCNDDRSDNFSGNDEDYVVIEIEGNNLDQPRLITSHQEEMAIPVLPRKKKGTKLEHVCSMGDEWIDMREKDDEFGVAQPIRRSISMDLSGEREFCLEIQGVSSSSQNDSQRIQDCNISSSSNRVRRSIFSFGYGRSSRGSVQPVHLDPRT